MTLQDWTNIATIIGISLILPQLALGILSMRTENNRIKKKATLDYYESINQELKNEKRKITRKFGEYLSEDDIQYFSANDDDRVLLHKVLNLYERLAIGININVYDIKTLNRLNGHLIINNYERYMPYINYYSKKMGRVTWNEFTILYNNLKKLSG